MTRKRRYLISAAVLTACVCIALGVLAMLPPRPGVTKANFDRIEKGMTLVEAEAIFGEYSVAMWHVDSFFGDGKLLLSIKWVCEENKSRADIVFSDESIVIGKTWESSETIPDKLRRWLHLP